MTSITSFFPLRLHVRQRVSPALAGGAVAGFAWNAFGIVQFARTAGLSAADLEQLGFSAGQAALYAGLPFWMTAAFFVGVTSGAIGSLLLLARVPSASVALALSLAAYLLLFAGDVALGVFAAFGAAQVAVISATVVIAAGLFLASPKVARGPR